MLPMLLLSNLSLVVALFGAVVFFSMSWLYFDALASRSHATVWMRAIGSLLLGLSYLLSAGVVTGVSIAWLSGIGEVIVGIKILGYLILAVGVWGESLSKRPQAASVLVAGLNPSLLLPILPAAVGLGYLRRASVGLERHLTGMAYGMYILSIAEILDLRKLFVAVSDVRIYEWVADFGPIWIVQTLVLLVGLLLISKWVFGYLLKRFETQITLLMSMLVLLVFVVATSVFSYVLAQELTRSSKRESKAAAAMIANNWGRRGDELLAKAQAQLGTAIEDKEVLNKTLAESTKVLDKEGRDVLTGESYSDTAIFRKVNTGKEAVGYMILGEGSSAQMLQVAGAKRSDGGIVIVTQPVSAEQLAQAASETTMAVRIYRDSTVIETSSVPNYPDIASPKGLTIVRPGRLGGVSYISALLPIADAEGVVVGKVEAAVPVVTLWKVISMSLTYVYFSGIILLLMMEIPAILIARYLTKQLEG